MKFPKQFVLQVAENEGRAWWGMREAICSPWAVNVCIVAQQCRLSVVAVCAVCCGQGWTDGWEAAASARVHRPSGCSKRLQ